MSDASPGTVFGLPTRNGERHLAEAIESLLAQTRGDLAVVVVDNCSGDGTGEIARGYAERDSRVVYAPNAHPLGLVDNWRRAFGLAGERYPAAPFFAWASDHDVWEPGWLELLAGELEAHPGAVLAYPVCVRIDESGTELNSRQHRFDTAGERHAGRRLRRSIRAMPAGDMIYGLVRRDALVRSGPFPPVLLPDRLLLARLSLEGEFRQVPVPLWRRRYREGLTFSAGRQRGAFLGRPPAHAYLPWWIGHTLVFARSLSAREGRSRLAAAYLLESLRVELRRRRERAERRRGWRGKRRRRLRNRLAGTIRRRLGRGHP